MNDYTVFKHPTRGYEAVKQGWSWSAFFFSVIWDFVKDLWLIALATILILLLIEHLIPTSPLKVTTAFFTINAARLSFMMLFGYFGNKLREDKLASRAYTYILLRTTSARTPEKACAFIAREEGVHNKTTTQIKVFNP